MVQHLDRMIAFILPESFEWLILKSGIVIRADAPELQHPADYIDSSVYASWKGYFNSLLTDRSAQNQYGHYCKRKLDEWYLQKDNREAILMQRKDMISIIRNHEKNLWKKKTILNISIIIQI